MNAVSPNLLTTISSFLTDEDLTSLSATSHHYQNNINYLYKRLCKDKYLLDTKSKIAAKIYRVLEVVSSIKSPPEDINKFYNGFLSYYKKYIEINGPHASFDYVISRIHLDYRYKCDTSKRTRAIETLQRLYSQDYLPAVLYCNMYKLIGLKIDHKIYIKQEATKAEIKLKYLTRQGNTRAALILARAYSENWLDQLQTQPSKNVIISLFEKATASQDNPYALFCYANYLLTINQSVRKPLSLLFMAANQKCAQAYYLIANIYTDLPEQAQNKDKIVSYYQQAKDLNIDSSDVLSQKAGLWCFDNNYLELGAFYLSLYAEQSYNLSLYRYIVNHLVSHNAPQELVSNYQNIARKKGLRI